MIRRTVFFALMMSLLLILGANAGEQKYLAEVLDNGLTVIVKHNPDSRVFAIDILGKNRAAMEKPEQIGITDLVNRMLVKGSEDKNSAQIQAALDDIGAKLQTNDNPYIPYDDRYTWRSYSFLRFETIDEFAKDGVKILYEIVSKPTFPENELDRMKKKVMGIMGMSSGSTYKVCRNLYYETMFGASPLSHEVMGSRRTIAGLTSSDLAYHHKIFYDPKNLIMTVVSNLEPKKAMKLIKKRFKNLSPYPVKEGKSKIPVAEKIEGVRSVSEPMEKEQVYIYLGNITPGLQSEKSAALSLAIEVLSSRLKLNLREKQGLAYSVGAGVRYLGEFGWYTCSIGTGYENFEKARDGIIAEIERLQNEPLSRDELDKAINSLWGSMLMRNMSCINQAYNMAYYEYVGVGYDFDDNFRERLDNVTVDDVQLVAREVLDTENYVLAYVGKVANEEQTEPAE